MSEKLRFRVVNAFKMRGYSLRSEAASFLVDVLAPVGEENQGDCIDRLIEAVQKQSLTTAMVTRMQCEKAVNECNQEQMDNSDNVFTVIDAFTIPRFMYNTEKKKFVPVSERGIVSPLHADASSKASFFWERYAILLQRTLRHDLFSPAVIACKPKEEVEKFQLKSVEYLLGSTAQLGDLIVLGMLTQMKEGKWFLEDPTGAVQLDLSRTRLFTENCFVLAEGVYEDGIFQVNAFGFPPPEPARITRSCFGNINFFGGPSAASVKSSPKLQNLEAMNEDAMFVFVSDVWLDDVKVMNKLKKLFSGYSASPPVCFVFCGNFTSQPFGATHVRVLKESFQTLLRLIEEFPSIHQNSRFVFVPGPRDPGQGQILPRPAIPSCITEEFRQALPTAVFTSNPCRIQYCTQEIIVFREDIVTKMCRNCVRYPLDGNIPTHFTKTIICQSNLCPLPLHVEPVYWSFDNALYTYPLPDVIVCADKYDPFTVTQTECIVTNPEAIIPSKFIGHLHDKLMIVVSMTNSETVA